MCKYPLYEIISMHEYITTWYHEDLFYVDSYETISDEGLIKISCMYYFTKLNKFQRVNLYVKDFEHFHKIARLCCKNEYLEERRQI